MSTQSNPLTPSTIPYEYHEPPTPSEFKKSVARACVADGDEKLGRRVEFCSTCYQSHLIVDGKKIKENKNPCHEYTLCDNCANLRSAELTKRYLKLSNQCPDQFTYIVTPLAHSDAIEKILRNKKYMNKSILIGNPGWDYDRRQLVTRFMLLAPIYSLPYIIVQALRQEQADIHIDAKGSSQFPLVLRELFTPHLPPKISDRLILKRMKRKVIFVGATQEVRKKLSDKVSKMQSDNFSGDESEKPACHLAGCIAHTEIYHIGTPEEELTYYYHSPPPESTSV